MPKVIFILVFSTLALFAFYNVPRAAVSSCSTSVTPTSVVINSSATLTFPTINNDSTNSYVWVRFTLPSSNFTITGGSAAGFNSTVNSATVITFTGGSIGPSSGQNFDVYITTGSSAASSASWTVQVSDNTGGSNPTTCSGNTSVSITSTALDTTPPILGDPTVTDVNDTSVKISWTTDEASNSVVNYGTTISYGSTKSDSSLVTSHNVELTGLSANTTYHFTMRSTDASGNTGDYGDSTFVTSKSPTTTTVTKTETKTVTKTVADTTVPAISLTTDFSPVYTEAPTIKGKASDDVGVSKVDYSIDDGRNWLPVDELSAIGGKTATFEFTPLGLSDGNYKIRSRVTDPSGNLTQSKAYTLVIDRLPPMVGPTFFSLGPQSLKPTSAGLIVTLPNLDQKIVLSAVGGATEINLTIGTDKENKENKLFSLVKNPDNGLWWGIVSFEEPGLYHLFAKSLDGAGNSTEAQLNSFYVLPSGKVTDGKNPVRAADVTLYFKEPLSGKFVIWEADSYGQKNPQKSGVEGEYMFFPPAGTYYLEVKAEGHKTLRSTIFNLNESLPIASGLVLTPKAKFSLGPISLFLPSFLEDLFDKAYEIEILYPGNFDLVVGKDFLNKELPLTEIYGPEGKVSSMSFHGKPTVLSLLTSWGPTTSEQIEILEDFSKKNQLIRTSAVLVHDQQSVARIFQKTGDYDIEILSDPDGNLIHNLNLNLLPAHVFLDRKGVVKNIKVGVLNEEEILDYITN